MGVALADAGYWSEANAATAKPDGPELLIATTKDWKQRKAARDAPPPRGRIPKGLLVRERMERKLFTKRGRELYKKRSQTVEPVFGQVKGARGCDGFLLRGLDGAEGEWKLLCGLRQAQTALSASKGGTHNLLKLWRSGKASWN